MSFICFQPNIFLWLLSNSFSFEQIQQEKSSRQEDEVKGKRDNWIECERLSVLCTQSLLQTLRGDWVQVQKIYFCEMIQICLCDVMLWAKSLIEESYCSSYSLVRVYMLNLVRLYSQLCVRLIKDTSTSFGVFPYLYQAVVNHTNLILH